MTGQLAITRVAISPPRKTDSARAALPRQYRSLRLLSRARYPPGHADRSWPAENSFPPLAADQLGGPGPSPRSGPPHQPVHSLDDRMGGLASLPCLARNERGGCDPTTRFLTGSLSHEVPIETHHGATISSGAGLASCAGRRSQTCPVLRLGSRLRGRSGSMALPADCQVRPHEKQLESLGDLASKVRVQGTAVPGRFPRRAGGSTSARLAFRASMRPASPTGSRFPQ